MMPDIFDPQDLAEFADIDFPGAREDYATIEDIHPIGMLPGEGVALCCHDQHGKSVLTLMVPRPLLVNESGEAIDPDEILPVIRNIAEKSANAVFN